MASKKIKINITLNDTKIQTSTQKIHQMCTNTKIHAALLKTKKKKNKNTKYSKTEIPSPYKIKKIKKKPNYMYTNYNKSATLQ
jgi:hypothetical protein